MKLVQVDAPSVLMYMRVEVEEPSVRTYKVPFEAANVGAPEPAVKPTPIALRAGMYSLRSKDIKFL